jgi:hypothetical protein
VHERPRTVCNEKAVDLFIAPRDSLGATCNQVDATARQHHRYVLRMSKWSGSNSAARRSCTDMRGTFLQSGTAAAAEQAAAGLETRTKTPLQTARRAEGFGNSVLHAAVDSLERQRSLQLCTARVRSCTDASSDWERKWVAHEPRLLKIRREKALRQHRFTNEKFPGWSTEFKRMTLSKNIFGISVGLINLIILLAQHAWAGRLSCAHENATTTCSDAWIRWQNANPA